MKFDATKETLQECLGVGFAWTQELEETCEQLMNNQDKLAIKDLISTVSSIIETPEQAFIAALFIAEHFSVIPEQGETYLS